MRHDTYRVRKQSQTTGVFIVSLPKEIGQRWEGVRTIAEESGNCLVLHSGASITTQMSKRERVEKYYGA